MTDSDRHDGSDDDGGDQGGSRSKSRRELPAGAVATLKAWLLSPDHFTHPYPTPQDQVMLMKQTGIDKKQLKNWFTNARRRIWKPMLKKQMEQGKLAGNGPAPGGMAAPGVVQGMVVPSVPGSMEGQGQFQQPVQQGQQQTQELQQPQQQQVPLDQFGNPVYAQQPQAPTAAAPPVPSQPQFFDPNAANGPGPMPVASSIGSLPQMSQSASGQQLSKTDSHAVLMELFARDQDLVRQAAKSAGLSSKPQPGQGQTQQVPSQHPMKTPSVGRLASVPTLTSWPHFSSVSSLNNLGTMPGVKSITSLSGADLAKQGPVNTVGNLAQVKSVESMGKTDSYAFLEVFFGDKSSNNLSQLGPKEGQRGIKREREEDNDVGLSLEDESPSTAKLAKESGDGQGQADSSAGPFNNGKDANDGSGGLKRMYYDDALAARGLISVSRSCEKLTDLPDKMQRTLSQEFMRQQYTQYQFNANSAQGSQNTNNEGQSTTSQQYPGRQVEMNQSTQEGAPYGTDSNNASTSVEVPSATKCALCNQTNVDTQLRPCGHMFHERCLKPSLQAPMDPPRCPLDQIPMQSALLAIPTDEKPNSGAMQPPWNSNSSSSMKPVPTDTQT